ncbi:MAG: phytanoyl-CoA dioxygenase family protein [Planctomycetes bacterium]|nr:phytanoyl-CoA dioxygenase family protein [Planctomycetota bacterium]
MFDLPTELNREGYAVVRNQVSVGMVAELRRLCADMPERSASSSTDEGSGDGAGSVRSGDPFQARRNGELYGIRNLLNAIPAVREIVAAAPFIDFARAVLGTGARPAKGVFFDKTPEANWPVAWHQDVTITVQERRDVPGFEMRPVKDGVVHALPPVELSENLLALRIHLDDADADHGALRVIPRSHLAGRLSPAEVSQWIATSREDIVSVVAGDVMLMRPLLLHASSVCRFPGHRRVVQIEYSGSDLPGGLMWAGS